MLAGSLTRQIIGLVAICLFIAEILIFVPSAARFQHQWMERQWQHFLAQFTLGEATKHSTMADLEAAYTDIETVSAVSFYMPDFICWKDPTGAMTELGHMIDGAMSYDLAKSPLLQTPLLVSLLFSDGPEALTVYDSRRNFDFRASWMAAPLQDELRAYAWRIFGLTLILGLIIITPLYFFLMRRFVRPISSLSQMIANFSQNPSEIPEPADTATAYGEIAQIATAFEDLAEQVRRALRQKERLADIGEATAKINHDLRNILVSATLVADMLSESDDPKVKQIAPHIERAITDAAAMTQNMMHYLTDAKAEEVVAFDLSEMADNLSHDGQIAVKTAGTTHLEGMPNLLYRLLLNLARNAKRAGAETLMIDVWRAGHLAVIDISDNGPGIDETMKPHLFSAFYSGHKRDTGLGLAIAKDMAVAMGGQLRLSRSSEYGSEFRLSVPAKWLSH